MSCRNKQAVKLVDNDLAMLKPHEPLPLLTLMLFLAALLPAIAAASEEVAPSPEAPATVTGEAIQRIGELDATINDQRKQVEELSRQLRKTVDTDEKAALDLRIKESKDRIARLGQSLEQLVIGGIDTEILSDRPPEKIDWRAELETISLPLLASLRELTAKPRRIESLRSQIDQAELKLELIQTALASVQSFQQAELAEPVKGRIAAIASDWESLRSDVQQALDVARLQLANLTGQKTSAWEILLKGLQEFVQGRGLTLVLAAIAGVLTWLLLRGLLALYEKALKSEQARVRTTRLRIVEYAFRTLTFLLVTLSIVAVFYVRNDLLLMALSLAVIIGLALGLRQVIPRYIRETRLLLDIGPVREGERVKVDGIPYKVMSLNVFTFLRNPRLAGVLRLPLSALEGLTSRPDRDEPWFPTEAGDYVLMEDGKLAKVLTQSVDFVQLQVLESRVVYSAADFIGMGLRNISITGFGLAVTFGIDYDHQAIALSEPPKAFREAVKSAMAEAGYDDQVQELLVEFKEAGASSLDYLIYVDVAGTGAPHYFKLGRLVQQACVRVCNERDWTIPFNQLTVHPGSNFQFLPAAGVE